MGALDDYPRVEVGSRAQWRAWLAAHHADTKGAWVVTFKKGRGPGPSYDDLVEAAQGRRAGPAASRD